MLFDRSLSGKLRALPWREAPFALILWVALATVVGFVWLVA